MNYPTKGDSEGQMAGSKRLGSAHFANLVLDATPCASANLVLVATPVAGLVVDVPRQPTKKVVGLGIQRFGCWTQRGSRRVLRPLVRALAFWGAMEHPIALRRGRATRPSVKQPGRA